MRIAAIDVGSNSVHMIVCNIRPDLSFEVIDREKDMIRVGAGSLAERRLPQINIDTAMQTLAKYRRLAESHGVDEVIVAGTSAIREAENGGDFISAARREVGLRVRVISGTEEAQFAGTVAGTERLLEGMAASACRRLVLCSSFSVYNYSATRRTLDEDSPLHEVQDVYTRDGYTIAKWWQERVTRRCAESHGWDLTVLRPGFIWGRDHGYLAALGQQFGRHHLVIGPRTRIPMTHVENCADVFALAAADPRAGGKTLNVVDGPGERVWSYLADHMRGIGQRGWRVPIPYSLALSAVRLASVTIFRRATKVPGILIPRRFESRLKPLRFDNRRLRETLGWTPPLDHLQCLARTYGPPATKAR